MDPVKEIALEVKNVSKFFSLHHKQPGSFKELLSSFRTKKESKTNAFYALKDISFTLRQGDALGIIGENGAGKSTLLKVLSGITYPDEGEINFYGRTVSILDIGAGFHPELTGRENIYLTASLYQFSRKEVEPRVEAIIAFSGIGKFIDEPVKNYSSGMYLRLAFSIITSIDADIYLIDEVISVGDADFQVKSKAKVGELINQGKTLIIVSHNLNEISLLCNRIILLEKGKVIRQGKFEVVQQYLAASVPQFEEISKTDFFLLKDLSGPLQKVPEIMLGKSGISNYVKLANGISNGHSFTFFIELELLQEKRIALVLRVFDQTNTLLFIATTFRHKAQAINNKGCYTVEFEIPASLLNTGLYTAGLTIFENTLQAGGQENEKVPTILYKEDKIFSIKIADSEASELPFTYPGIIKPAVPIRISYNPHE